MDGHDPNGAVIGLGNERLGHPRPLAALHVDPAEVGPQRAAGGIREGARLVGGPAQAAPGVPVTILGERQLHQPALAHHPVDDLPRAAPQPLVVQFAHPLQRLSDRVVGLRAEVVPGPVRAAAALPVLVQVVVAEAEGRRAQRRHHRQTVRRGTSTGAQGASRSVSRGGLRRG